MTNVLPTYPRSNLEFTHGLGSYLYTKSGEKFLDFGTGIAVNSLGYSNPYLNDKLKEQKKIIAGISEELNIPITYYEKLYGEDRMESFEVINKWELDLDPFQLNEYLHPSNRYRQFGDRNPI